MHVAIHKSTYSKSSEPLRDHVHGNKELLYTLWNKRRLQPTQCAVSGRRGNLIPMRELFDEWEDGDAAQHGNDVDATKAKR